MAQVAVQSADGQLLHPPLQSGISDDEREFLVRIRQILMGRLLGDEAEQQLGSYDRQQSVHCRRRPPITAGMPGTGTPGSTSSSGSRDPSGAVIAVELDRARLLADLLVELSTESRVGWARPSTGVGSSSRTHRGVSSPSPARSRRIKRGR